MLVENDILERVGRGRGTKYILSKGLYSYMGRKGVHTRKHGLDRNTNKELILMHIRGNQEHGCAFNEFAQVLPGVSVSYIQGLLRELKGENKVILKGRRRWARWYLVDKHKNN
jgi:ATP-dependent DNA helicase RecG